MTEPLHILLVEDSADDAQLIMLQLEGEELEAEFRRVDTEADFKVALASIPDMILSDYSMPQFNGLRALRILRESGLDIPFILISGTVGEDIAVDAIKQGADDYMMKDRPARLGSSIRQALEQKRLREEKARAEIALRDSEARFRALIENSSDEISIVSADGTLLYESPTSSPTLGYEPGTYLGRDLFQLVHPNDLERVQSRFNQLVDDPGLNPREQFRLLHRDGTWRWVEAVGTNLLNEPAVCGVVINYHDVTERVRAEEALRVSEERYRALFEDTPISIWEEDFSEVKEYLDSLKQQGITDFQSHFTSHPEEVNACAAKVRIVDVNKAALQIFRAKSKEELLTNVEKILNPGAAPNFQEELVNIAAGMTRFTLEASNQTLDGRRLDASLNWSVAPGHEEDLSKVIVSIMDITERKQAEQRIERQLKRLNALHTIDKAISSSFELRTTLEIFLTEVTAQLEADAASVLLFNKDTMTLNYSASRGFRSSATQHTRLGLGEGYAGRVVMEQRNIYIPNLAQSEGKLEKSLLLAGENFTSYFGTPLIAKGQIVGVLEIFQRAPLEPDGEWLDFLENLASQAAIAIDDAQLFEDLQRSNFELTLAYEATIEGWSQALDLRDKETEGHTQRVTSLTVKLARQMGISDAEIVHIRRGALLHDIGKMGVPDNILNKPGKLTDDEWEVMHEHPALAHKMLTSIGYLKPALDIPYCHHEKWDGTGYPQGLSGRQIPLAARIFAVVDVWDALTSDRPYRNKWGKEEAMAHIKAESGRHFDPKVVDHFLQMINEETNQEASVMQEKKF